MSWVAGSDNDSLNTEISSVDKIGGCGIFSFTVLLVVAVFDTSGRTRFVDSKSCHCGGSVFETHSADE